MLPGKCLRFHFLIILERPLRNDQQHLQFQLSTNNAPAAADALDNLLKFTIIKDEEQSSTAAPQFMVFNVVKGPQNKPSLLRSGGCFFAAIL